MALPDWEPPAHRGGYIESYLHIQSGISHLCTIVQCVGQSCYMHHMHVISSSYAENPVQLSPATKGRQCRQCQLRGFHSLHAYIPRSALPSLHCHACTPGPTWARHRNRRCRWRRCRCLPYILRCLHALRSAHGMIYTIHTAPKYTNAVRVVRDGMTWYGIE